MCIRESSWNEKKRGDGDNAFGKYKNEKKEQIIKNREQFVLDLIARGGFEPSTLRV